MEELDLKLKGLEIVDSSRLITTRGGTTANAAGVSGLKKLAELLKELGKYIPDFIKGLKDGLK